MKSIMLCMFFIIVVTSIRSQQLPADSNSFFKDFKFSILSSHYLKLDPSHTFKKVTVIDNRPDTTHLGLFRNSFGSKKAISFEKGENLEAVF